MSEELPKLDEATLQNEAAAVERLRRHISELPSKGEVVTPQLLAQFAVAQKRYLDRKIEFEKQRRSTTAPGSGIRTKPAPTAPVAKPESKVPVKAESLPVTKPEPTVPVSQPVEAKAPVAPAKAAQPAPAKVPVPELPTAQPKKGLPIVWIIAGVAIALAIVAWRLVSK